MYHPMRWVWIGLGVLLVVFGGLWLLGGVWLLPYYGYGMPMIRWGFPLGVFGFIVAVVFIMMIVRLALWGSWVGHRRYYRYHGYYGESRAEEILRERYARGEITKEQFDQMMQDIRRDRPSS